MNLIKRYTFLLWVTLFSILMTAQTDSCFHTLVEKTLHIDSFPLAISSGDFNNDGKLDIIVLTSVGSNPVKLWTLTSTGGGNFSKALSYTFTPQYFSLNKDEAFFSIADVNNDNNQDVLVTFGKHVYLLRGNGNCTFTGSNLYSFTGSYSYAAQSAIADFNHDNILDFVVAGYDSLCLFSGSGNGTFAGPIGLCKGSSNEIVNTGDLNGDGNKDIVATTQMGSSYLYRLYGQGNFTFLKDSVLLNNSGSNMTCIGIGDMSHTGTDHFYTSGACIGGFLNSYVFVTDINKNGFDDIITAGGYNNFSVLVDSLKYPVTYKYRNPIAVNREHAVVGDFNGDNNLDLVLNADTSLMIFYGDSIGHFNLPFSFEGYAAGVQSTWYDINATDVDNDQLNDIIVSSHSTTDLVSVLRNSGNNRFKTVWQKALTNTPPSNGMRAADLNNDGKQDILILQNNNIAVFLNNGNGTYGSAINYSAGFGNMLYYLCVMDVNSDGNQDVGLACYNNASMLIMLGNGAGGLGVPVSYSVGTNPCSLGAGDLNNDGNIDIAVVNYNSLNLTLWFGNGTGGFSSSSTISLGFRPVDIDVGDYNKDGFNDLIIGGEIHSITVYKGVGNGTFIPSSINFYTSIKSNKLRDINGDGYLDIYAVDSLSKINILTGNGTSFNLYERFSQPYNVGLGKSDVSDLNGDGIKDLLYTGISAASYHGINLVYNEGAAISTFTTGSLCHGDTVVLKAPKGCYTYNWLPGNLTSDSIVVLSAGNYSLTVTNNFGACNSMVVKSITFNPILTVTGSPTVCTGDSAILMAHGANSYWWNNGATDTTHTIFSLGNTTCFVVGTDQNGCRDTLFIPITVNPLPGVSAGPNDTICILSSVTLNGSGALTYSWNNSIQNGMPFIPQATMAYIVTGIDANNCQNRDTVQVVVDTLCQSVWPGDANNDLIDNNNDLLEIGLQYGKMGSPRSIISNSWLRYNSPLWGDTISNGFDADHADCNGDGTITLADTLAINLNYSLTHPARFAAPQVVRTNNPDVYLTFNKSLYYPGDTLVANVNIGSSINPQVNFYGAAFTLNYDNSQVKPGSEQFYFNNSWAGNINQSKIKFKKIFPSSGKVDVSLVRITHADTGGFGKVATFTCILRDTISVSELYFTVDNAIKTTKAGVYANLNVGTDSVTVEHGVANVRNNDRNTGIFIYPSPTSKMLNIVIPNGKNGGDVSIMDLLGNEALLARCRSEQTAIDISQLPNGVYILNAAEQHLRFVKE